MKAVRRERRVIAEGDFDADWRSICRDSLATLGYTAPPGNDTNLLTRLLFNVSRRRIRPAPRRVHRSSRLTCPAALRPSLESLLSLVERGADINAHQSRRLVDAQYNDPLLNDWGIHHWDLGEDLKTDGFVEGTGPLLFARVTEAEFFALNVLPHGSWSRRELLETLHADWPDSIRRFRMSGMTVSEIDEETHGALRGRLIIWVTLQDGATYAPLGGGSATSGDSVEVVRDADRLTFGLRELQRRAEHLPRWMPICGRWSPRASSSMSRRS